MITKFSEGQRVRVVYPGEYNDQIPHQYMRYEGGIGYISEIESESSIEVTIAHAGVRIHIPGRYLELAELHRRQS